MKAAVVTDFSQNLLIVEQPVPEPGPDEVLVRLEASGLCHMDIHAARGEWPVQPTLPFIPGHEGVGIIEKLGSNVHNRWIGDRVAIPWLGSACGECRYCVDGRESLCESQNNSGYSTGGMFAEWIVARAKYTVPVPNRVSAFDAAPLSCAGLTAYKAMKTAAIVPTERVAVFGIGGVGHLAVQYAQLMGGTVIAVDVDDNKLELARELGADSVINASRVDPVAALGRIGGVDVAVVLTGAPHAFEQALASLRSGGRLICVALPADGTMTVPIFDVVLKGISIIGSTVGTRQDLIEVLDLHAMGRTRVIAESRDIRDINSSIEDVLLGHVQARLVFEY